MLTECCPVLRQKRQPNADATNRPPLSLQMFLRCKRVAAQILTARREPDRVRTRGEAGGLGGLGRASPPWDTGSWGATWGTQKNWVPIVSSRESKQGRGGPKLEHTNSGVALLLRSPVGGLFEGMARAKLAGKAKRALLEVTTQVHARHRQGALVSSDYRLMRVVWGMQGGAAGSASATEAKETGGRLPPGHVRKKLTKKVNFLESECILEVQYVPLVWLCWRLSRFKSCNASLLLSRCCARGRQPSIHGWHYARSPSPPCPTLYL